MTVIKKRFIGCFLVGSALQSLQCHCRRKASFDVQEGSIRRNSNDDAVYGNEIRYRPSVRILVSPVRDGECL